MKILHIIGSMDPKSGGPCQGIRNSIKALQSKIKEREVVSLDDPGATFLGKDDFTVHALGPANNLWRYSSKLRSWLDQNMEKYDAIIINGIWLYHSYAVYRSLQRLKKKRRKENSNLQIPRLFIMPHGMLDPYFQKAKDRKLKAVRNWIYWKLIECKVVNSADGLLFTCQIELELARKSFSPYHPKRELNVGYGVEKSPCFNRTMAIAFNQKCPVMRDRPYLLFLSRIHEKKGIDILLEAYRLFNKDRPNSEPFPALVIAGPGLETYYGHKMQQLVEDNSLLKGHVFFPGMLEGDAKWGAFYGCEAFILPSHQENFGIAVVEALACKKPVLISDQVNICEEIKREGGGFVGPDSVEGTERLLFHWLQLNHEQQLKMGEDAYKTFEKNFNVNKVADRFLEAISS